MANYVAAIVGTTISVAVGLWFCAGTGAFDSSLQIAAKTHESCMVETLNRLRMFGQAYPAKADAMCRADGR